MAFSVNKVIEYFDLGSKARPPQDQRGKGQKAEQTIHWLPQYIALLLGIAVQPFFQQYMTTGHVNIDRFWGWLLASLVIAVMAFPGVYKNSFDPKQPIFVQFCVIFTTGTGWQTLVSNALRNGGGMKSSALWA